MNRLLNLFRRRLQVPNDPPIRRRVERASDGAYVTFQCPDASFSCDRVQAMYVSLGNQEGQEVSTRVVMSTPIGINYDYAEDGTLLGVEVLL